MIGRLTILVLLVRLLAVHPAFAFTVVTHEDKQVHWDDREVSVELSRNVAKCVSTAAYEDSDSEDVLVSATAGVIRRWANVDGTTLKFKYGGLNDTDGPENDGRNTIVAVRSGWEELPFGASNVIGLTLTTYSTSSGLIKEFDTSLNCDQYKEWAVNNPRSAVVNTDAMDYRTIIIHEIGHGLGGDHSTTDWSESDNTLLGAVMFAYTSAGSVRSELNNDDRNLLRHLYAKTANKPRIDDHYPKKADNREANFVLELAGHFTDLTLVQLYNEKYGTGVIGKVEDLSDDHMVVSFNLIGMPPGETSIIVSNSPETQERIDAGLMLSGVSSGSYYEKTEAASAGGCGVLFLQTTEDQMKVSLVLVMLALMTLIQYRWRLAEAFKQR